MTARDIFIAYMVASFIAACTIMLIGSRLHRRRNQSEALRKGAAESLHGAGGGEIIDHAEANDSLRSRNHA